MIILKTVLEDTLNRYENLVRGFDVCLFD